MSDGSVSGVVPRFDTPFGRAGVHIQDPIEDVQAQLFTDSPVTPTPASTDEFVYPVDSAVEVTATRLRTPFKLNVWIRDLEGNIVAEFNPNDEALDVSPGDYSLDFSNFPMKVYIRVENTGFNILAGEDSIDILFDPNTKVRIGARSLHSQPGRTLTTTSDPTDLMDAVSLFGNAMKTWAPERTFPTLRGHPPLIELDSEPDLPSGVSPPDTGIGLTVPADHGWLYPVIPLAYWLGATVEPGDPALSVSGTRYPLGSNGGYTAKTDRQAFESHVKDILQFSFQFECALREFYNVELDIERRIETADLPLDLDGLADRSIADRMRAYMDMDLTFAELADRIGRPDWRLTADIEPTPQRATTTPFLARDLAVVRCQSKSALADATHSAPANAFTRSSRPGNSSRTPASDGGVLTRSSSTSEPATGAASREEIIELPAADSMSQAWVGDGFAVGAAKATTKSYLQRLEKQVEGSSRIGIDVVVNDEQMAEEADVSDIYGTRDHLNFDINLERDLTQSELAAVFQRDSDFVHYIGHVDPEGFDCSDGHLDAAQIGEVGADTFVLNACSSYEQGQHLVDSGAIAGVVTLEDVISSMATKIGRTIARLLNCGFPVGSATNLIQDTMFSGGHYAVVGDSNATLAQTAGGAPEVLGVDVDQNGRFELGITTYASWNFEIGTMVKPDLKSSDCSYVVPGALGPWSVDETEFQEYLDQRLVPVIADGEFFWSEEVTASELRDKLET